MFTECKIKMKGHWSDQWASARWPRHHPQVPSSGSGRIQNTERAPSPTTRMHALCQLLGAAPGAWLVTERTMAEVVRALPWAGETVRPSFQLSLPGTLSSAFWSFSTLWTQAASLKRCMWRRTERGLRPQLALNSTAHGDWIRPLPPSGLGEDLPHQPAGATTCRTSIIAQEMLKGKVQLTCAKMAPTFSWL